MKRLATIFLTVSVIAFALSLTAPGSKLAWGVLTPLSAILIIAFFITNILANEYAMRNERARHNDDL